MCWIVKGDADKVITQDASYVLRLKGNQGWLHVELAEYFVWAEQINFNDLVYDYSATLQKDLVLGQNAFYRSGLHTRLLNASIELRMV
jgi:hypothetical protein